MEIVQTGVTLYRPAKGRPGGPQVGDVARLASGRLVARYRFDFDDGTRAYACRDYDPGENPETAQQLVAPTNWNRWIDAEVNRYPDRYHSLEPADYALERAEIRKFQREWPHLAARLAEVIDLAVIPVPTTIFELGPVLSESRGSKWRRLTDQHAAGSFGLYGEYDDSPVTDEELWTLSEQPILVANKAAIAANSGPVRSRFLLGNEKVEDKTKHVVADIVTVLSPRGPRSLGPRTLMTWAYVD
jgi:hypothetical protein